MKFAVIPKVVIDHQALKAQEVSYSSRFKVVVKGQEISMSPAFMDRTVLIVNHNMVEEFESKLGQKPFARKEIGENLYLVAVREDEVNSEKLALNSGAVKDTNLIS